MEQPAAQDRLIGVSFGNYVVTQKLGEGGMGSVYMAEHPDIGKKVALKILHPEFSNNEDVAARFFTEAKAVNAIQHPNIVDIIDYGQQEIDGQNTVYFIMEFLVGESLSDLIRRESPLAPERALNIAVQIADALSASHRNQIVHRDLKPDNVMLIERRREHDFVKVLDFGIAKLTGDQSGSRKTRTGIVMGTPAYMSPEQCEGRGSIDHRTDIYSLGILLYEMLTGRVPFGGDGYGEILVKHLTQPPAPVSSVHAVPPHVEAVCMKALEKDPANRFPSMDEFVQALSDPVGYVEARGGVAAFLSAAGTGAATAAPGTPTRQLDVSGSQPYNPYTSPVPGQVPMTPAPGQIAPLTPPPGMAATAAPGSYAGPAPATGKSHTGIIVAAVAIVLVAAGGGFLLLRHGGGRVASAAATADAAPAAAPPATKKAATTAEAAQHTAPADAAPAKIKVSINSNPAGAQIFRAGESTPIGTTPYTMVLKPSAKTVKLTLKHAGYKDRAHQFVPNEDQSFLLDLQPVPKPAVPEKAHRTHHYHHHKTSKKKHRNVGDNVFAPSFGN